MKPVAVKDIPHNIHLPMPAKSAISFVDKNGKNLVVFMLRESKNGQGLRTANLRVQHLVVDPPKVLRDLNDFENNCHANLAVEFRDAARAVTDLNGDGYGEVSFAYSRACRSDLSPSSLKYVMLENGAKYILRGTTRVGTGTKQGMGGTFVVDPSFKKAPPSFLTAARAGWKKVVLDSESFPAEESSATPTPVSDTPNCKAVCRRLVACKLQTNWFPVSSSSPDECAETCERALDVDEVQTAQLGCVATSKGSCDSIGQCAVLSPWEP